MVSQNVACLRVVGDRVHHLDPRWQMHDAGIAAHHLLNQVGELQDRRTCFGSQIEYSVERLPIIDGPRDGPRHILDVRERAGLRTVTEDRAGFAAHDLVEEDRDDVAISVGVVLTLPIHVVSGRR